MDAGEGQPHELLSGCVVRIKVQEEVGQHELVSYAVAAERLWRQVVQLVPFAQLLEKKIAPLTIFFSFMYSSNTFLISLEKRTVLIFPLL